MFDLFIRLGTTFIFITEPTSDPASEKLRGTIAIAAFTALNFASALTTFALYIIFSPAWVTCQETDRATNHGCWVSLWIKYTILVFCTICLFLRFRKFFGVFSYLCYVHLSSSRGWSPRRYLMIGFCFKYWPCGSTGLQDVMRILQWGRQTGRRRWRLLWLSNVSGHDVQRNEHPYLNASLVNDQRNIFWDFDKADWKYHKRKWETGSLYRKSPHLKRDGHHQTIIQE